MGRGTVKLAGDLPQCIIVQCSKINSWSGTYSLARRLVNDQLEEGHVVMSHHLKRASWPDQHDLKGQWPSPYTCPCSDRSNLSGNAQLVRLIHELNRCEDGALCTFFLALFAVLGISCFTIFAQKCTWTMLPLTTCTTDELIEILDLKVIQCYRI